GNVMTRGQPVIEALLESGLPFASGPEWLAREVLKGRWVLAVAGTHGKTTSASLLAWILEHAGRNPGFLIGGVPANFGVSARLGAAPCFVIEADEYDTAFFDKRAKFVHYSPRTLILNNLEYDHADIYPDVGAIQRQFHHLVRIVPGGGRIVWNAADARHAGVELRQALDALQAFEGIARRLQLYGEVNGIRVYDDFAHHPTAITTTIDGLRRRVGAARIIAVLEPRSHTMRMGVHR